DEILADGPDEFYDPLTCEIMRDPVWLPTSKNFCDRSTISQHLLNDQTDPFNRQPLTQDKVEEAPELKAKIEAWIAEKVAASKA
ncbi:hypothetical protein TeGR_g3371, partial [Tetraparma gracilis]